MLQKIKVTKEREWQEIANEKMVNYKPRKLLSRCSFLIKTPSESYLDMVSFIMAFNSKAAVRLLELKEGKHYSAPALCDRIRFSSANGVYIAV